MQAGLASFMLIYDIAIFLFYFCVAAILFFTIRNVIRAVRRKKQENSLRNKTDIEHTKK
jgi:flagellar biosynthesis/type III secretory pathway M-ring protein FliF/YscJ